MIDRDAGTFDVDGPSVNRALIESKDEVARCSSAIFGHVCPEGLFVRRSSNDVIIEVGIVEADVCALEH